MLYVRIFSVIQPNETHSLPMKQAKSPFRLSVVKPWISLPMLAKSFLKVELVWSGTQIKYGGLLPQEHGIYSAGWVIVCLRVSQEQSNYKGQSDKGKYL